MNTDAFGNISLSASVSVIIPTFNRAALIKESIQSILNQSIQPMEIIIVDDFSTDNTVEIVNSFNNPLIKCIKNSRSKGANGARNTGIIEAKGDFIAFHDSDDVWYPNKLELQIEKQKSCDFDLVFCKMLSGKNIIPTKKINDSNVIDSILEGGVISTQMIYIKTDIAKRNLFDEKLFRLQDWDFVISLIEENIKIGFVDVVLVSQYISHDSISKNNNLLNAYSRVFGKYPFLKNKGINNKVYSHYLNGERNVFWRLKLFSLKLIRKGYKYLR